MKKIDAVIFQPGSREELLPGFSQEFPYICSCSELDKYPDRSAPWHWHKAVELFYMEKGSIEYYTSSGRTVIPEGSGGIVNSNVLHMTRALSTSGTVRSTLHIFDTSLIGGRHGSRIEQKYITPVITASRIELLVLSPDNHRHTQLLNLLRDSFLISEQDLGYELRLRSALSEIWLGIYREALPLLEKSENEILDSSRLKELMTYVHEHFSEKITVQQLSSNALMSERECFRLFHDCLHTSPMEYVRNYRLQMACQMLIESKDSITVISHTCGLGNSSHFGKIFREAMNCTPSEYRQKWQNHDI
ncbi:AraC family transcriptional regulator [Blautia sp. MSJ-19]|uniref:AraC family transcriptional regulator n=1 Tax=Blautia sp. MSJ-19 TaxID=2841517 RepID=UPI001C0EB2AD|nr:AraC family transcriptional regulator [Blautia sp. MSJ-19]MBU5482032.1 AraC family transcriptional regulator [Blautia sp. MSJ-19]